MSKTKAKDLASAAKPQRKTDTALALLRQAGGASLSEITQATGWLPHSARAVLTGFRKRGYTLGKSKLDGISRYVVTAEPSA